MNLKLHLVPFVTLCICFLASAQIVNKGLLKIKPSTNVYFLEDYTNDSTGEHRSDGNFYLNSNFVNHGATSASAGTTYFKSSTNTLLTLSGNTANVNFYNLEIDVTTVNKKGVAVADAFFLHVSNAINFKNGDLRLIGKSQLIQDHSGADTNTIVNGKLLIDQKGTASPFQYNYWSSPVNNGGIFSFFGAKFDGTDSAINPFNPKQILFNSGFPYNGLPSISDVDGNVTTALTITTNWLYKYTRGSGSYAEWIGLNSTSILNPGEGYTMKGTNTSAANQNYVFYGAPNNGDYQFEITSGETILLGNPYPSTLDALKFLDDNLSQIDALYFWVDGGSSSHYTSDYLGGYAIWNHTGGTVPCISSPLIAGIGSSGVITAPTQYVPVGKGFFVEAIGSGTINFNNSQRIFNIAEAKESTDNGESYVRLGYEDPEGFHRQLLLGFLPNSAADLGYNPGYDAVQIMTRADDLFFIIDNKLNTRYSIQGVNAFSDAMEFPLGLLMTEEGMHQIMLDNVENLSNSIYLKDHLLNTTHNLSKANFEINLPAGAYLDRFSLVFQPIEALSTSHHQLEDVIVYYKGDHFITVTNPSHHQIKSIEVYNMLGQQVKSFTEGLNPKNNLRLPFNENEGVYLVILKTNSAQKSTKILNY